MKSSWHGLRWISKQEPLKNKKMNIENLLNKQGRVWEQAKAILQKCEDEKRAWTPEEKQQYDGWIAEFDSLDGMIKAAEREVENRAKDKAPVFDDKGKPTGQNVAEKEVELNFALETFVRKGAGGLEEKQRTILGLSRDEKGLSVNLRATAGVANPTYAADSELMKTLTLYKQYYAGWLDAVTEITTQKGNTIYFPEVNDTAVSGSQEAAGTDMVDNGTALTLARVQLDAYPFSSQALVVDNDSLEDFDIPLQQMIWDPLTVRLWKAVSAAFTTGTGSTAPDGIVTNAGVGEIVSKNTTPTATDIYNLMRKVNYAYTLGPKAGFMMNSDTMHRLMALAVGSSDSRPIWQPSFSQAAPPTIAGKPYWINNDMATVAAATAKVLLFGDFSTHLVRYVGTPKLVRLDERYAELYRTAFIILWRIDCDTQAAGTGIKYARTLGT
jgi:HK97 family phage major capsid protein